MRALTKAYFLGLFFLSCLCLAPWIVRDSYYGSLLENDAINKPWWAFFTTASMYANVGIIILRCVNEGYTLTPDGMISFQEAVFPLLVLAFMMVAGYLSLLLSNSGIQASLCYSA
jgi:Trk-type K+ transport system membrane component